ncbi:MAG: hypothetical protein ABW186_15285 [Rhodanobacteraceae bacterium]
MKFVHKSLGLLLASLVLASCGGGGGDGNSFTSPSQSGSITLTPAGNSTVLPLNVGGDSPYFVGSPYANEVDIHWTNADGSPVSGHDLSCSVSNLAVLSIHVLDDASTPDVDESVPDWGNIQVHSDTGHAVCYVFSTGQAGQATLTVGGVDPITNATISKSLTFTVQNASAALPASVTITSDPPGVYFSGSNGNQSSVLTITVLDGGQQPVPNPTSGNGGADNVLLEIVTNPAGGARLSANSVAGPVSGPSVATHTVNGIATASFQSGDVQGPIQIRATSDRSDNNVTNGISDPVSTTFSVTVSDGKLFAIQITSPDTNAIFANSVSGGVTTDDNGIPPDPDATYSLTVSALATDRQGAPVLPGTTIHFGSIDEPTGAFDGGASANRFVISGNDGNPQEGGTLFTAPSGQFQTAGGGAGPGDALIVFGKTQHGAPPGNEDLESAVTIASITSQTSLTVNTPFNRNDTTGALVDNGPVLPYIIGRSNHGNITATATTDEIGVAHATLNYTVSTLGHIAAIWAQGDGIDNVTGGARRVTDATELLYPGIAPASLTAFPTPIPGNTPQPVIVTVCLVDALSSPIQGISISYQMQLGGGTGSIDGNGASGTLDNVTGPDGCVNASVTTSGLPPGPDGGVAGQIVFSAGDATATVDIIVELAFLQASPRNVCPGGVVNISAISSTGAPASGVTISSSCATPSTATTGQNGVAAFRVSAGTAAGACEFTADDFGLSVSVQVGDANTSPPCGSND